MSMVRFAMVCDGCQRRGPEYDASATSQCRECGREVCQDCRVLFSEREPDAGFSGDCLCLNCKDDAPGATAETLREAW